MPSGPSRMRPGEGERRALSGLVPQYRIAAEKIYGSLCDGRLESVAIANPDAGTLDDIGVVSWHGSALVLDAYQVKWSSNATAIAQAEFRSLLSDLCTSRRKLISDLPRQRPEGPPVTRVIAHLYSNRPASTSNLNAPGPSGKSLATFIDAVWGPASRLDLGIQGPSGAWRPYLDDLAAACGCDTDELVGAAPDLKVELGRGIAEHLDPQDREDAAYLRDLDEIYAALLNVAAGRDELAWLTTAQLLDRLGPHWRDRVHRRRIHEFRAPENYEPLTGTQKQLSQSLERLDSGYLALTGSPGSGKSTLLTVLLRTDPRLAARYYAYVPDDDHVDRGEARSFLHDLTLTLSQGKAPTGPRLIPRSEDLDLLRRRFTDELNRLGADAVRHGTTAIVLVDGLDHVQRAPRPREPLLEELPPPAAVPAGVLIVLGTRSVEDLPGHIRPVATGLRHVETGPLARQSVIDMATRAGLPEFADRIWRLSAGHPLLTRTFLGLLDQAAPETRDAVLEAVPENLGEVWDYYESVWEPLRDSHEMIVLLGLLSRVRGPIRLRWLAQTGTSEADIDRLGRLSYLFNEDTQGNWTFFHSSFQEFLRNRTAEVAGRFDAYRHRALHLDLAERASASAAESPEGWQRLHQFLEAGRPEKVIEHATPDFFRCQLDALRPGRDVIADVRQAAGALAERPVPAGAVRLALAAHEVEFRGYQFPYGDELLQLLARTGRSDLAIAQVGEIDDMTSGNDRRASAMQLALELYDAGDTIRAREAFDAFEPLEWFGGRVTGDREPHAGPYRALRRWARAAVVIRGVQYVLDGLDDLDPPAGRSQDAYDDEELDDLRRDLLLSAAHELIRRDLDREDVLRLEAHIEQLGATADIRATLARLKLALWKPAEPEKSELVEALVAVPAGEIVRANLVMVAMEVWRAGAHEQAHSLLDGVTLTELPERYSHNPETPSWNTWHNFRVLRACLDGEADPAAVVPDSDKEWRELDVVAARHVVVFANLEARHLTGPPVAWAEVAAALRRFDTWWESPVGRDMLHRPGEAKALIYERAIALARQLGPNAVKSLFEYCTQRWDEDRSRLHRDSPERLVAFRRAGVPHRKIEGLMRQAEQLLVQYASPAEEWIELGLAWFDLRETEKAQNALAAAARRTMTLGASDKDLQLGTWTTLMAPYLRGPDGRRLARALADAIIEIERLGIAGAADHAAEILLRTLSPAAASTAVDLGRSLADGRVLSPVRVIDIILEALATAPSDSWWIALQVLVTLGSAPPRDGIARAAVADPDLARKWLPTISDRVSVEGQPSERIGWRSQLREAADTVGLTLADLALDERDFEVGPETPARDYDQPSPQPRWSTGELFDALDADERIESRDPAKELIRRIEQLTPAERERLSKKVEGGEYEAHLHAALARHGTSVDQDAAWEFAMAAVAQGDARAWQRTYSGGPVIDAIQVLRRLSASGEFDAAEVDRAVYERFADLAVGDDYFLQTIGRDLDDYCEILRVDPDTTACEALATTRALLRDVSELPDPRELRTESADPRPQPDDIDRAVLGVVVWLLAVPFNVAWEAAQRAALELVAVDRNEVLEDALSADDVPAIRALALVDAAIRGHGFDAARLCPSLLDFAVTAPLDVRAASVECLRLMTVEPPAHRDRPLPAAYRLQLPPDRHTLNTTEELTDMVGEFHQEIAEVAKLAELPEAAVFERVLARARELGASHDSDEKVGQRGRAFGWRFLRPSARITRHALAVVCAEIVDAGIVTAYALLHAADLWPAYDPALMLRRPTRRPADFATFISVEERSATKRRDLAEIAAQAPTRLARWSGEWVVLGESSEIATLDHYDHREHRWSGVVLDFEEADADRAIHWVPHNVTLAEYQTLVDHDADGRVIVRSGGPGLESPSQWLGIHPRVARQLGLQPDQATLDWTVDGEPAVRSVWWRSGFPWWSAQSDIDEVGDGWLVLASPQTAERIEALSGARRAWRTSTSERPDRSNTQETIDLRGDEPLAAGI